MGTSGTSTRLFIPYDSIEDHFHCSICLSAIRGAVLTPCGHRYCTRCITEWVGRNHSCPCCKSPLTTTQFYSDVQFDSFVDEILLQRDRAEQTYFEKIVGNISQENTDDMQRSAFEVILYKHMKSSLLSHQRYFDKLKEEHERKIHLLETGMSMLLNGNMEREENIEETKANMKKNMEESEKLAADAFDRFLTDNVPTLDLLPATVTVYVAEKELRIPDIIIKPSDNLSAIKPQIEAAMRQRSDDVTNWTDDEGTLLLFSPLSKSRLYDIAYIMENIHQLEGVFFLTWESRPIFQFLMRPGSEIVLSGTFKSQSDLPKRCFASTFQETGPQPVDYFTCATCNIKWICKSCIQSCHQGHNASPFVMGHIPTWACCYCLKKKLCKIQEQ